MRWVFILAYLKKCSIFFSTYAPEDSNIRKHFKVFSEKVVGFKLNFMFND